MNHSMKLARKGHLAEDSNITVARNEDGTNSLIIGSGYGYIGNLKSRTSQPVDIDEEQLSILYSALDDTAKTYFGACFDDLDGKPNPVQGPDVAAALSKGSGNEDTGDELDLDDFDFDFDDDDDDPISAVEAMLDDDDD